MTSCFVRASLSRFPPHPRPLSPGVPAERGATAQRFWDECHHTFSSAHPNPPPSRGRGECSQIAHGDLEPSAGFLCFRQLSAGDLLIGSAKVAGSAQRRQRRALLKHGAILLAGSPFTPSLPGIRELTGIDLAVEETNTAVLRELVRQTGWDVAGDHWSAREQQGIDRLLALKYTQECWNAKR